MLTGRVFWVVCSRHCVVPVVLLGDSVSAIAYDNRR